MGDVHPKSLPYIYCPQFPFLLVDYDFRQHLIANMEGAIFAFHCMARLTHLVIASNSVRLICCLSVSGCNQHASLIMDPSNSIVTLVTKEIVSTNMLNSLLSTHHLPLNGLAYFTQVMVFVSVFKWDVIYLISPTFHYWLRPSLPDVNHYRQPSIYWEVSNKPATKREHLSLGGRFREICKCIATFPL